MRTLSFTLTNYPHANAEGDWVSIRVTDENGKFICGSYNRRENAHQNVKHLIEKYG